MEIHLTILEGIGYVVAPMLRRSVWFCRGRINVHDQMFLLFLGDWGGRGERKDHNSVFGGAEPWRLNITPFVIGGVRVPCISGRNEGG